MTTPDEAREISRSIVGYWLRNSRTPGESDMWRITEAALRSLADQLDAATKWRPIETAPRDGTSVLLWDKTYDSVVQARWDERYGKWLGDHDDLEGELESWLTCWLPLPPPPEGKP